MSSCAPSLQSESPSANGEASLLRGSAWEFLRDTALNTTGFFKPASGEKPPLERNQFGGVLGGPIVRNRAFFFADYEGFRQRRSAFRTFIHPESTVDGLLRSLGFDLAFRGDTPMWRVATYRRVGAARSG